MLIVEPTWSSHIVGLTSSSQSVLPSQSSEVFVPSRSVEENIKYHTNINLKPANIVILNPLATFHNNTKCIWLVSVCYYLSVCTGWELW